MTLGSHLAPQRFYVAFSFKVFMETGEDRRCGVTTNMQDRLSY